jgi:hypothetical protein
MIYNKKGQLDYPIITFFVLIFGLIIISPIVLKILIETKTAVGTSLANIPGGAGNISQENLNKVLDTGIGAWDKVIIAAFFFALLLLVISAIFIDTNPFFIILYIILNLFLIIFSSNIIDSADNIYNSQSFAVESSYLSFLTVIKDHFGAFLVGVMVFTGIIIYGKIVLFNRGAERR